MSWWLLLAVLMGELDLISKNKESLDPNKTAARCA